MPFTGDFRGCTWNSQALFAHGWRRHNHKLRHAKTLLATHDFVGMQETHSVEGRSRMLRLPGHSTAFYSHGTSRTAGVCLWVKKAFLQQFNPITARSWVEVEPGRAAILRLDGHLGSLDLGVVYLHSGAARAQRDATKAAINRSLRSRESCLSLLFGDWNFVTDDKERFHRQDAGWTGERDGPEQDHFHQQFQVDRGFQELAQEEFTHDSERGESRLDRVYSNHPMADQLDRDWGCAALQWVKQLSNHRPVSFYRKGCRTTDWRDRPLPVTVFSDPAWASRTAMTFSHMLGLEPPGPADSLRQMVLLKEAMTGTAETLLQEGALRPPAQTFTDKLGATMRFIRAAERVNLRTMRLCAQEYPHISTLVDHDSPGARTQAGMASLRQHAVELARKSLMDEMRDFHRGRADMDQHQASQVKERIHAKLRRLAPGGTNTLTAIRRPAPGPGLAEPDHWEITTRPDQIAAELTRHWGKVFGNASIDEDALRGWLRQAVHPPDARPPTNAARWHVRKKDVARAIRCSGSSMPGPDRIPYVAWKRLGPLAVDVLFGAATAMARDDFPAKIRQAYNLQEGEDHPFNLGLLVCIPKKVDEHHPQHGAIYTAEGTRPLSIVDTANRILANAYRYRWEPTLAAWVSPEQRGFLPGRSILANVVDVEEAAAEFAMTEDDPAIFLFDFSAAFPSIHQTFLLAALEHIGLPPPALAVVRALYDCCRCVLCFGGERWPGFHQQVGIRQGCPLSPLLFAVVVDLFLRRLKQAGLSLVLRAYADDIAVVVRSARQALPSLHLLFQELSQVSNLALNLPKTVCIPLWEDPIARVKVTVTAVCPPWADITVADHGKYLGFYVGPGRGDRAWIAAGNKMLQRGSMWDWSSLGMYYATTAYNTYVASLPCYVAQLDEYPAQMKQTEEQTLRKAAAGPYRWAMPDDLARLADHYGQSANFHDLETTALAAKVRVATFENNRHGGLHVTSRARALRRAVADSTKLGRRALWHAWIKQNPLFTLQRAVQEVTQLGLAPSSIMQELAGQASRPWSQPTLRRIRARFQSSLATRLRRASEYNPVLRMRHKLQRWQLLGPPAVVTARVLRRLTALKPLVAPRVQAAVLSTLWNRWTTGRRFQRQDVCVLGCSLTAADSIEHYAHCPVIRTAAQRFLGLHMRPWPHALCDFLLATGPPSAPHPSRACLTRSAILLYAAYTTTNAARHRAPRTEAEAVAMMQQAIAEGVRGHPGSQRTMAEPWAPP